MTAPSLLPRVAETIRPIEHRDFHLVEQQFLAASDFPLLQHSCAGCIVGSHAYGTFTDETRDVDLYFVVVPPLSHALWSSSQAWRIVQAPFDVHVESLTHFTQQLLNGNPTALLMLFHDGAICWNTKSFRDLREYRHHLLTQRVIHKILGHARRVQRDLASPPKEDVEYYDRKQAAHVLRLLVFAKEILAGQSPSVVVYDPIILAARQGSLSRDQVSRLIRDQRVEVEHALASTFVRAEPPTRLIRDMAEVIYRRSWFPPYLSPRELGEPVLEPADLL